MLLVQIKPRLERGKKDLGAVAPGPPGLSEWRSTTSGAPRRGHPQPALAVWGHSPTHGKRVKYFSGAGQAGVDRARSARI
jgi:hypothetical protein